MDKVFKQIPIGTLYKDKKTGLSPTLAENGHVTGWIQLDSILMAVKTGRLSLVVTEKGGSVGFMTPLDQMEEVLAHEDNRSLQPEAIAQRELTTDPWNVFDLLKRAQVIKITFHGRARFALISPELQNYLPLPLIGRKEVV